jgi:hypothetical protein
MSRKVGVGEQLAVCFIVLTLVWIIAYQSVTIEKQRLELRKVVETHCGFKLEK